MANIIRLGSLYLCGNPVSVEDDYLSRPNWSIEIGETVPRQGDQLGGGEWYLHRRPLHSSRY